MKLELSVEEVLEIASKSESLKIVMMEKFPYCFHSVVDAEGLKSSDNGDDSVIIKRGDYCYTVHGNRDLFRIIKSKYPNKSSGAVAIFRGDNIGRLNASYYVICKTKRFTLEDVQYAFGDGNCSYGAFITRLNYRNDPDSVIVISEDKLNANNL